MKWLSEKWEALFDFIYNRYVKVLRENKELKKKLEEQDGIIVHSPSFEDTPPTQKDKPGPSSSLSKTFLQTRLKKAFPESKYSHFTVQDTNSMEPYIDDNSVVIVEDVNKDFKFREGQVIIYKRQDPRNPKKIQFVVHMIIEISLSGLSFYIKGDNNYFADGWVPLSKIKWNLINIGYYKQTEEGD